jgi:hypothetical protein
MGLMDLGDSGDARAPNRADHACEAGGEDGTDVLEQCLRLMR